MLRAARMMHVDMLVLRRDVDAVTERLGELGVIEPKPVETEVELPSLDVGALRAQWAQIENRATGIVRELTGRDPQPAAASHLAPVEIETRLSHWEEQCERFRARLRDIDRKQEQLAATRAELAAFQPIPVALSRLRETSFLHFAIGSMDEGAVRRFAEGREGPEILLPFQTAEGESKLLAITTRRGRWALESDLEKAGFEKDETPQEEAVAPAEAIERLDAELAALDDAREDVLRQRRQFAETHTPELEAIAARARQGQRFYEAQSHFARTQQTVFISGWAPAKAVDAVREAVLDASAGRAWFAARPPRRDEEAPVLMENPAWLRPFEQLTRAYGVPGYNDIEPTAVLAISFLLMFGLMFGDVGQGAAVALLGWWLSRRGGNLGDAGAVMTAAGLSAVVFGFLYGSVFGMEGLIPALWMEPMEDIPTLMVLSVALGVVIISLGIVFNVVNRVRRGEVLEAVLDRFGVVGAVFYWGCLGLLLKQQFAPNSPVQPWEAGLVVGAPLLLLFVRAPLINLLRRKKRLLEEGVGLFLMESLVETAETLTTFVSNTASFVRVSAFALAHVGLCTAVFALADIMASLPLGGVWKAAVIVIGNILVILLEGMVASIQALRLEYYEFFNKFFTSLGKPFKPFRTAS